MKAYQFRNMGKHISYQPRGAWIQSYINRALAQKKPLTTISKEGRELTTTLVNEEAWKNSDKWKNWAGFHLRETHSNHQWQGNNKPLLKTWYFKQEDEEQTELASRKAQGWSGRCILSKDTMVLDHQVKCWGLFLEKGQSRSSPRLLDL